MRRPDGFRGDRWARAGATPKEIGKLRTRHRRLSAEGREEETARVDSISDHDLAAELADARPPADPEGDTPPPGDSDPTGQ